MGPVENMNKEALWACEMLPHLSSGEGKGTIGLMGASFRTWWEQEDCSRVLSSIQGDLTINKLRASSGYLKPKATAAAVRRCVLFALEPAKCHRDGSRYGRQVLVVVERLQTVHTIVKYAVFELIVAEKEEYGETRAGTFFLSVSFCNTRRRQLAPPSGRRLPRYI